MATTVTVTKRNGKDTTESEAALLRDKHGTTIAERSHCGGGVTTAECEEDDCGTGKESAWKTRMAREK